MGAPYELRKINGVVKGMAFKCPGCNADSWVSLDKFVFPDVSWDWDNNEATPTLYPSILNNCCGWHGFMTAGVFQLER